MAKRKDSSKRPQAKHKPKSRSSQHDKRKRLGTPNPRRKKTVKAKVPLTRKMAVLVASMTGMLDARMAFRLSIIMAGMVLADDRRVAASWFAAAGVQDDWDRFYDCLISVGRKTQLLAFPLLLAVVRKFAPGPEDRMIVAVDDSPTRRYRITVVRPTQLRWVGIKLCSHGEDNSRRRELPEGAQPNLQNSITPSRHRTTTDFLTATPEY